MGVPEVIQAEGGGEHSQGGAPRSGYSRNGRIDLTSQRLTEVSDLSGTVPGELQPFGHRVTDTASPERHGCNFGLFVA